MEITRRLRRALQRGPQNDRPFLALRENFVRCQVAVKLFYLISIAIAFTLMPALRSEVEGAQDLDLLWPVFWMERLDLRLAIDILTFSCFLSALWAFWKPNLLAVRAGFAILLLLAGAIHGSFGGINHVYHIWIWVSIVFVFLPKADQRVGQLAYCLTFAMVQALVLFFYSLAGFWKLGSGILMLLDGREGNLSPRGLALTLADRMLQTGTEPLLARIVIDHYYVSWALFLGLIYAQFVAIVIVFRPRLHVIWGLILVGFHTGTWLLMEITNVQHLMVLFILMVMSPFAKEWKTWETLKDMPLIGGLFYKIKADRQARTLEEQPT